MNTPTTHMLADSLRPTCLWYNDRMTETHTHMTPTLMEEYTVTQEDERLRAFALFKRGKKGRVAVSFVLVLDLDEDSGTALTLSMDLPKEHGGVMQPNFLYPNGLKRTLPLARLLPFTGIHDNYVMD